MFRRPLISLFFFFNDTATTEIYTLSLHTLFRSLLERPRGERLAVGLQRPGARHAGRRGDVSPCGPGQPRFGPRSEEHTSELQSQSNLVCRLLLEKKKISRCVEVHVSRS